MICYFWRRVWIVYRIIKFKKVKKIYKEHSVKEGLNFVDSILEELNLTIDISEKDLKKIESLLGNGWTVD